MSIPECKLPAMALDVSLMHTKQTFNTEEKNDRTANLKFVFTFCFQLGLFYYFQCHSYKHI